LNAELPARLASRLQQPLPSWSAQARYQPELSFGRHRGPAQFDARPAAVLILLYPHRGEWHVPLILRPAHMLDHAGQVSLPGGAIEPGETGQQAALREFYEELGVPAGDVRLLGPLSELYLFASNFRIEPWVGAIDDDPAWNPSQREVDRLLEVPLAHLMDPANTGTFERRQRGVSFRAPCFCWDSERIWGATSMVLAELVAIAKELPL
jgi:8-oxo-dGTP pyrophosphatase MutT (NUDIX family)